MTETRDKETGKMFNECPICGDEHDANLHGDALVIRDWSVRDVESMVQVAILDAMSLAQDSKQDDAFNKLAGLYDEWSTETDDAGRFTDPNAEPGEYLDDVESILADAGYFAYSDSDAGSWLVFGPARDPSERIIGATS